MKVLWINNDGGGFADYVEVAEGTTVERFLAERLPNTKPGDYLIRVNRQPVARDQVASRKDVARACRAAVGGRSAVPPRLLCGWRKELLRDLLDRLL